MQAHKTKYESETDRDSSKNKEKENTLLRMLRVQYLSGCGDGGQGGWWVINKMSIASHDREVTFSQSVSQTVRRSHFYTNEQEERGRRGSTICDDEEGKGDTSYSKEGHR